MSDMLRAMQHKKHLFFDMDQTVAPSRQPILPEMYDLLTALPHDLVIVSGQLVDKIKWQSNELPAYRLGQNGNHAVDHTDNELWHQPLEAHHRAEIMAHIDAMIEQLTHELRHEWSPIEDRGAQITFSPIGNTAPVEIKQAYDPDRQNANNCFVRYPSPQKRLW